MAEYWTSRYLDALSKAQVSTNLDSKRVFTGLAEHYASLWHLCKIRLEERTCQRVGDRRSVLELLSISE